MSWSLYTEKMREALLSLSFCGSFTKTKPGMRLVTGRAKKEFSEICFFWLVDEQDGVISDVSYQAIGETPLLAFLEITSSILIRKTYDQASRISSDLLEKTAGIQGTFPIQWASFYNLILEALDKAVYECLDIPFADNFEQTPLLLEEEPQVLEDWPSYPLEKKLSLIQRVLEEKIRPYIELDAGGVEVVGLSEKEELTIRYSGSCTGCYAATGSTLSAIQNILQTHLYPSIRVIPEL